MPFVAHEAREWLLLVPAVSVYPWTSDVSRGERSVGRRSSDSSVGFRMDWELDLSAQLSRGDHMWVVEIDLAGRACDFVPVL